MSDEKVLLDIVLSLDKFLDDVLRSGYFLGTDYHKEAFRLKIKTECYLNDSGSYFYRCGQKFKWD